MNTTKIGKEAENIIANELIKNKHKIIEMNWRTKWCEIDIVSKKKNCVYFTEVKFRSSNAWGSGLDYVTNKKMGQMKYAAEFWMHINKWDGECLLQAAGVDYFGNVDIIELTL